MTTENVAVLLTDLVGSTERAHRLAPDAADDDRRRHFSLLRQATAESGGTEVKNLGDGLMIVFSSASAAISCAVSMQQAVERDARDRLDEVGLRVGLSGGEVSREGDDYFGDPVIEAARLCAVCEGGQILAADVVRAMAGRRNHHPVETMGPLALRGLPEPLDTVEVLWEPLPEGRAETLPLPLRMAARPSVGVIGRGPELERVVAARKRVIADEACGVLLVSGEAGVGKSTLVAEAARSAFADGASVLYGHCEEDLAIPYCLFAEALAHYVNHAPEEALRSYVSAHGSELGRLVPTLGTRLPDLPPSSATDADAERYLLFAAAVGILATISEQRPVVLVLDDLQWADRGSLLLLRHLVAAGPPLRILVLGTYRDSELSHSHDLLDTLSAFHRLSGFERIELGGFDDSSVVDLMEAAAGHSLDQDGVDLAHAVRRETEGNPFFVSEMLRHLAETGAIRQDDTGRWMAAPSLEHTSLPDSVRVVIGGRVGRLGPTAQRVLSQASVVGQDFELDVLALSSETSEDDVLDVLDEAIAASLVREQADASGRYRFAHALVRRTLYEDLGPTRRARAHRRVAESIESLCDDHPGPRIGELAHHWFHATQPVNVSKAVEYARQAGDAALEALAPDGAVRYYTQAIQLLEQDGDADPALEIDLLIGLGRAKRQAGASGFRETLLDAARRAQDAGDTDRMVAATLANNRGLFTSLGVVDEEKVEMLEAVLEAMPPGDSNERALLFASLCNEVTHGRSLDDRMALATAAREMARRLGDPATIVEVVNLVEQPLEAPATLGERITDTVEALSLASDLEDPLLLYFASVYRRITALVAGEPGTPTVCLDRMRAISERLRQPILIWITAFHEAAEALVVGDHERAEVLSAEALQIGTESGQPDALSFYGSQMVLVRHQQGRLGELLPVIESVATETGMPHYRGALAAALLDVGHRERATELLRAITDDGFTSLPMGLGWFEAVTGYAQTAIQLAEERSCALIFDLLAPFHGQMCFNGLMVFEPVDMYLGSLAAVLGHYEEAEGHFADAASFNERMGCRFSDARTNVAWARMLADRGGTGDLSRARDLADRARTLALEFGYGGVAASVTEVRDRLG